MCLPPPEVMSFNKAAQISHIKLLLFAKLSCKVNSFGEQRVLMKESPKLSGLFD